LPKDTDAYLKFVDDIYQSDAYHSLSIEGYRVTPELIARAHEGTWNPEAHEADHKNRDALAARGYWQASQRVKNSIAQIIAGADAAKLVPSAHRDCYRELFQPCVAAGLIGRRHSPDTGHISSIYKAARGFVPLRLCALRCCSDFGRRRT